MSSRQEYDAKFDEFAQQMEQMRKQQGILIKQIQQQSEQTTLLLQNYQSFFNQHSKDKTDQQYIPSSPTLNQDTIGIKQKGRIECNNYDIPNELRVVNGASIPDPMSVPMIPINNNNKNRRSKKIDSNEQYKRFLLPESVYLYDG